MRVLCTQVCVAPSRPRHDPSRSTLPVPPQHPTRRAFGIVELMVAIAIIAILLGLLLPSVARARETANRAKCLSNLRQLGLAFTMYLNENKGRFPRPAQ